MSFWRDIYGNVFLNSASLVRRRAFRSPQRNPYSSPTCSSSSSSSLELTTTSVIVINDLPFKLHVILCPNAAFDTSLASHSNRSQTVNFREKKYRHVQTCIYVNKSAGRRFWSWGTCYSATSRIVSFKSYSMPRSQYHHTNTFTHKPQVLFDGKKLREQKQTRERIEEEDGRAQMKSSGGEGGGGTVYRSSFESANHSEGEHQLVRFFLIRGWKNERRRGQVHMKAVEINTSLSPQ